MTSERHPHSSRSPELRMPWLKRARPKDSSCEGSRKQIRLPQLFLNSVLFHQKQYVFFHAASCAPALPPARGPAVADHHQFRGHFLTHQGKYLDCVQNALQPDGNSKDASESARHPEPTPPEAWVRLPNIQSQSQNSEITSIGRLIPNSQPSAAANSGKSKSPRRSVRSNTG